MRAGPSGTLGNRARPSVSVLSVQAESVTYTWPRMEPCRWQLSNTGPGLSMRTSAALAGLPSSLPSSRSSKPVPSVAIWNAAAPAAVPRTWWSQVSRLTKRTVVPVATTLTAGTKRIFSCSTAGLGGSRLGLPAVAGYSTTTASDTGLPSLSST